MKWGNAIIESINNNENILSINISLLLDDKDFKSTKKLNWLSYSPSNISINLIEYDHLITIRNANDFEGNYEEIINKNSKSTQDAKGEVSFKLLKKGDRLQIERRGYYIVDRV